MDISVGGGSLGEEELQTRRHVPQLSASVTVRRAQSTTRKHINHAPLLNLFTETSHRVARGHGANNSIYHIYDIIMYDNNRG